MVKLLVTYASEHGGTAQIAQTIVRVLRQADLDVVSKRIEDVNGIAAYDALVLGSAIYLGEWLPEAEDFLKRYQRALAQLPVWLFSSGPTGEGDALKLLNGASVPENLQSLVSSINPRDVRVFHGKIDLRRLPPNEREIIKAAAVPRGDYRDWDAIKLWAQGIVEALSVHAITKAAPTALVSVDS